MRSLAAPLLALLAATGAAAEDAPAARLDAFDRDAEPRSHWKLPKALTEISGLAAKDSGTVLAHDDEHAIVYELDPATESMRKAFAVGDPVLRGDFEGIALAGSRLFLLASEGWLYETTEGADGERVTFRRHNSGAARRCREMEGLAFDREQRVLWLACKFPRRAEDAESVLLLRWAVDRRAPADPAWVRIDDPTLRRKSEFLRPSAIEWDARTGHLLVLSSRARSLVELTRDGRVLARRRLDARHRQPEGLALTASPAIAIADEGAGKRGRLTLYELPAAGSAASNGAR